MFLRSYFEQREHYPLKVMQSEFSEGRSGKVCTFEFSGNIRGYLLWPSFDKIECGLTFSTSGRLGSASNILPKYWVSTVIHTRV